MAFNPVNPNGQATGANSAPVVLASDVPVTVDDTAIALLAQILVALNSIQGTKGVLADLRVTPTGSVTVAQATATNLNATVTFAANQDIRNVSGTLGTMNNINGFGPGAYSLNNSTHNWQNMTAQDAFIRNMVR